MSAYTPLILGVGVSRYLGIIPVGNPDGVRVQVRISCHPGDDVPSECLFRLVHRLPDHVPVASKDETALEYETCQVT